MFARMLRPALIASLLALLGTAPAWAQSAPSVERSGNSYHVRVCTAPGQNDMARCHAEMVTDQAGRALVRRLDPSNLSALGAVPYYARDLWAAYYGTTTMPGPPAGTTAPATVPTIAVVDAYGYPGAATDLATYRRLNGLPPLCSATVTSNCVRFTKLNQSGYAGAYPQANTGWAQESALDIQMVSALCPFCNIVLVQANSATYSNLAAAEVTASKVAGVIAISNSYGGPESGSSSYAASYGPTNTVTNGYYGKIKTNIAITVSSGDSAYAAGTQFPASAPYVLAVGGTSLRLVSGSWTQSAWSSAGSGCSTIYSQMSWQTARLPSTGCKGRVVSDVSAVADPSTGVAVVYGPYTYQFGGTSVSAPIIAGIIGQRNQPIALALTSGSYATATYPTASGSTVAAGYGKNLYAQYGALRDVTTGNNGTCAVGYVCTAGTGYDGPTGLGTANGISNLSPF